MFYTKILTAFQILDYHSISAHPLSISKNLEKRGGIIGLASYPKNNECKSESKQSKFYEKIWELALKLTNQGYTKQKLEAKEMIHENQIKKPIQPMVYQKNHYSDALDTKTQPNNPLSPISSYSTSADHSRRTSLINTGISNNHIKKPVDFSSTRIPERNDLIKTLPALVQPHVEKMLDVKNDGHCGFCAVAFGLGRGQEEYMEIRQALAKELESNREFYSQPGIFKYESVDSMLSTIKENSKIHHGREIQMRTTETLQLVANTFLTPVFLFSKGGSFTYFPHNCPPNDNPPIFLSRIPGVPHIYALKIKQNHSLPIPKAAPVSLTFASIDAQKWAVKYPISPEIIKSLETEVEQLLL